MMSPRGVRRQPKLRVACLQLNAGRFWPVNLAKAVELTLQAVRCGAKLVALPEMFFWRGPASDASQISKEACPAILKEFRHLAKLRKMTVLLGSLLEPVKDGRLFYNTAYLISPSGRITARYRKMHLFDVKLPEGRELKESERILPGRVPVAAAVGGIRMGLSICYDLRFPELYRMLALRGCRVLFVPANFTHETGKAHWETLVRARAIENQVFILAPAQTGRHPGDGVMAHGCSLIVDPWGKVLRKGSASREEIILADLDFALQDDIRSRLPALRHVRIKPATVKS